MVDSYYVYLSNDETDAENGTEHTDWISFLCTDVSVAFVNNNEKTNLPEHKSFIIKMGQMSFNVTLKGCIIRKVETGSAGNSSWNDLIEFVGKHVMAGGDTFYLWVRPKMADATDYMQWFDGDGSMQDYMQCRIKSLRFTINAKSQTAKGSITLEEEWG